MPSTECSGTSPTGRNRQGAGSLNITYMRVLSGDNSKSKRDWVKNTLRDVVVFKITDLNFSKVEISCRREIRLWKFRRTRVLKSC